MCVCVRVRGGLSEGRIFLSELNYSPTDCPEGLKMLPQSVARFGATAGW